MMLIGDVSAWTCLDFISSYSSRNQKEKTGIQRSAFPFCLLAERVYGARAQIFQFDQFETVAKRDSTRLTVASLNQLLRPSIFFLFLCAPLTVNGHKDMTIAQPTTIEKRRESSATIDKDVSLSCWVYKFQYPNYYYLFIFFLRDGNVVIMNGPYGRYRVWTHVRSSDTSSHYLTTCFACILQCQLFYLCAPIACQIQIMMARFFFAFPTRVWRGDKYEITDLPFCFAIYFFLFLLFTAFLASTPSLHAAEPHRNFK